MRLRTDNKVAGFKCQVSETWNLKPRTWNFVLAVLIYSISTASLKGQGAPSDVQILNKVFDATNQALKINVVANGGGGAGAGDFPNLTQLFNRAYDPTSNAIKVNCVQGCGGGAGATFQVNATNTSNQTTINFQSGAGVTVSNPSAGNVAFTWSAPAAVTMTRDTLAFASTLTMNMSNGGSKKITLTGNVASSSITNPADTQLLVLEICQDSTGGRTFAWPANVKGAGTPDPAAGTCSAQQFQYDAAATNWYAIAPMMTRM